MDKTVWISAALLSVAVAVAGCSKKEGAGSAATSKSGLAWTPVNYGEMSAPCKKALACCEDFAKQEGAKSAMDFNGKCSGPAMWKDDGCETDLKARVTVLESDGKPVPEACK
jgi:hypothetical protein